MSNCEICDQELVEGDFEEKLGICVNCIMIESREKSSKSVLILFMIFVCGLMFISAFISVIFSIGSSFISPPLMWCVISGSGLIYFSIGFKFR
ncbi:MAG: hypothetical protein KGD67_00690 [Candidatus Lokiarchaeota archaeon]|nr:hypothetical protein [Candidatus Lokiarchaeota archaeon]